MFLGQYAYNIDTKGRLTIPVRFRAALADGAFIVQGFDRNLLVFTTEGYQRLAKQASIPSMTDQEARAMRRVVFGRASEIGLDSAGRILIPPFLREWAGMDSEVTIIGTGDYFEIWNSVDWGKELDSVTDPEVNTKRFEAFDLSSG